MLHDYCIVSSFVGCVSMLVVGHDEMNIVMNNINRNNIGECDSCAPSLCQNEGVCQVRSGIKQTNIYSQHNTKR